jgi:penicillin-binding protein A
MDKTGKQINIVFRFYMGIFFLLGLYIAYVMGIQAFQIDKDPKNPRNREELSRRGRIYSRSGKLIAYSQEENGIFRRIYPEGQIYEPMLGYVSPVYGKSGIEEKFDNHLGSPRKGKNIIHRMARYRTDGEDIYLTIDHEIQREAFIQLKGYRGAIVAINPGTGEILAMASSPSFDPQYLGKDWNKLTDSPNAPLFLRPVNGYYPPGSVLKLMTLASCYEKGKVKPDTIFNCTGKYPISYDQGTYYVHDAGSSGHGSISAADALVYSCNVTFAQMGLKLGPKNFVKSAEEFGLMANLDFSLTDSTLGSTFPDLEDLTDTQLAQAAFGQGKITLSPLQVALMTSAFANDGRIYRPQLIKARADRKGDILWKFKPKVWKTPISGSTASKVRDAMVETVERGTATRARIPGVKVAGKTGTAENPSGDHHAWFACFAPAENPEVLVVVILENGGYGGVTAVPRAAAVLEKALQKGK